MKNRKNTINKTNTSDTQKGSIASRKKQFSLCASLLTAMAAFGLTGCGNSTTDTSKDTKSQAESSIQEGSSEAVAKVEKDGFLSIPTANLSQKASFFKADLDGEEIEVIALKDSNGNLRTAFNACQVCYSSGKGYYVQDGDYLVCQNCGNSFTIDQVGVLSGGCNPWPILDDDRTVTDDEIQISYNILKNTADELPNFFQQ